jgi:hypothetical protein
MTTLTKEAELYARCQPPVALDVFAERIGKCPETVIRWRDAGMIRVHNINGKNYLLAVDVMLFNARLVAGEFAKEPLHIRSLRSRRNKARSGAGLRAGLSGPA